MNAKRVFDIAGASLGLAMTGPVILALAALVKLSSPGPAFFLQTRVGRGRKALRLVKLRTMVVDAERIGPQVTAARDPRVTRLGRALRAAKLDELPQLWNVLRGDMSLVGPRPEAERYVAHYRPEWEPLLAVRPGMTDEASLVFRSEEQLLAGARDRERAYVEAILPAKLGLALQGIERESVLYDINIVARTVVAVAWPRRYASHPALERARNGINQMNCRTVPIRPGAAAADLK